MLVIGTISSVIFNGIYIFGFLMSWAAVNKLAESKITIWAIKMYLEEKDDELAPAKADKEQELIDSKSSRQVTSSRPLTGSYDQRVSIASQLRRGTIDSNNEPDQNALLLSNPS